MNKLKINFKKYTFIIIIATSLFLFFYEKNVYVIIFLIFFLFIPSVIMYFLQLIEFNDFLEKIKQKDVSYYKTSKYILQQDVDYEIEKQRKILMNKLKNAYISFFLVLLLIFIIAFVL